MNADYIDHMGTDLSVVNAARVSFDTVHTELTAGDHGLIRFLARGCSAEDWDNLVDELFALTAEDGQDAVDSLLKHVKNMPTHWTPFAHPHITLRETIPIFTARQRFKHTVGFVYNEVSRRYVDDTPEFHYPEEWRCRPEANIKQGSGGVHPRSAYWFDRYEILIKKVEQMYNDMIADGVAPEQARMIIPQSMMTSYHVTGSLYAWANAYIQRSDGHAQLEIQHLAQQWNEIIEPLYPVSWKALTS